jgi:hypothetical protein
MIGIGRRLRPSPAMAVAFIALFIALAGTAYSVSSQVPGKGGVKASDIAKGAVKKGKIAGQAVAAGKIANGAVETAKIADNAVTSGKIADNAVTSGKIADRAVTSGKFFLSVVSNQNIGPVAGSTCSTFAISTPGIQATDHVLVTPPPGWTDTFTLVGDPDPTGNQVVVQFCNTFTGGGAADPDGGGGPYKVLVIR